MKFKIYKRIFRTQTNKIAKTKTTTQNLLLKQFPFKQNIIVNFTTTYTQTVYLQWCLLFPAQNALRQPMQCVAAWSGTQSVTSPAGCASTASHDVSERRDSTADAWPSPALHTESTTELYKQNTEYSRKRSFDDGAQKNKTEEQS